MAVLLPPTLKINTYYTRESLEIGAFKIKI